MAKKKASTIQQTFNPNWIVSYEYKYGKEVIVPGTLLKFKYDRETYKFKQHVFHTKLNKEWIDVIGPNGYHSFYVHDLKGIAKPKVKRIRKIDNE